MVKNLPGLFKPAHAVSSSGKLAHAPSTKCPGTRTLDISRRISQIHLSSAVEKALSGQPSGWNHWAGCPPFGAVDLGLLEAQGDNPIPLGVCSLKRGQHSASWLAGNPQSGERRAADKVLVFSSLRRAVLRSLMFAQGGISRPA